MEKHTWWVGGKSIQGDNGDIQNFPEIDGKFKPLTKKRNELTYQISTGKQINPLSRGFSE